MNKDDLSFKEAKLFAEELFIAGVESVSYLWGGIYILI